MNPIHIEGITVEVQNSAVTLTPAPNQWRNDGTERHLWRWFPSEDRPPIVRPSGVAIHPAGFGWRQRNRCKWYRRPAGIPGIKMQNSELVGISGAGVRHREDGTTDPLPIETEEEYCDECGYEECEC